MDGPSVKSLDELLSKCIHCGLCLPVCPTYSVTFNESSSPRGRIRLMRSFQAGELGLTDDFVDEMNFCLDCQACETACPAGVHYAPLVENARDVIVRSGREPWIGRTFRRFVLDSIFGSRRGMKIFNIAMRLFQKSGLREAIEQSNLLSIFSSTLNEEFGLLPWLEPRDFSAITPEVITPAGEVRGRVALLTGCLMNSAFARVHKDCVEVLVRNGYQVCVPKDQGCCGSLHAHNGERERSRQLAGKIIELFADERYDFIVVDSAGCAAFIKEYGGLFPTDDRRSRDGSTVARKTREITEFLVEVGYRFPSAPIDKRVTYHEACHLVHTQKISDQPRRLIGSIPGVDLAELPEATWCCGSAGIYNLMKYQDARKFLDQKTDHILGTKADIVLAANPGCHLQLEHGLRLKGSTCEVMHPVSLLNLSYKAEAH